MSNAFGLKIEYKGVKERVYGYVNKYYSESKAIKKEELHAIIGEVSPEPEKIGRRVVYPTKNGYFVNYFRVDRYNRKPIKEVFIPVQM